MMDFDSLAEDKPAAPQAKVKSASAPSFDSLVDDEDKYGSGTQQAIAGVEGAASALTFGLSTGVETALGVKPEDIRMRREVNPGTHMAGELAGLGVGMFYGAGEAALLERAGVAVAKKIAGETALSKAGGLAARLATENAMFQAGDEVSKMFSSDPHQTIGTALADVGLAGLFGGVTGAGIGAVSPLWKATAGKGLEKILNGVKNKAGGIEGLTEEPVAAALEKTGLEFAPEVRAAMSGDPGLAQTASILRQSDTSVSGPKYQATEAAAKKEISDYAAKQLGADEARVRALSEGSLSPAESGKEVGNKMADDFAKRVEPVEKEYKELSGKAGNVELKPDATVKAEKTVADPQDLTGVPKIVTEETKVPGAVSQMADDISKIAAERGWVIGDKSSGAELFKFTMKNLKNVRDVNGLNGLVTRLDQVAKKLSTGGIDKTPLNEASVIRRVLRNGADNAIEAKLGEGGAELVQRFQAARKAYGGLYDLISQVDAHLNVKGKPTNFAGRLREMAGVDPERILRNIGGKGNAAGLELMAKEFPDAAAAFRKYHVDALIKAASKEGEINPSKLVTKINDLTPEMRSFLFKSEQLEKIRASAVLKESLESAGHNFSNTARTRDKLSQYVPGGAAAVAAALSGSNPALGFILGQMGKYLAKDVPDAIRLSMLKFVGSNRAVDAAGFKAMADVARSVYRGEQMMNRAARGVLKTGTKIQRRDISENDNKKLDKQLLAIRDNPAELMNVGGDIGHYLPDHATHAALIAGNAAQYLNALRPGETQALPLDSDMPPDPTKVAAYERALEIAQDPVRVMEDVKEGSITPADLETLQNVAPGFYAAMRQKLMNELVNHKAEEEPIPYRTKIGMALFLGQPLDSTMTPQAIQMAQPVAQPAPMAGPAPRPTKSGMQKLSRLGPQNATGQQSREMGRAKHLG